MPVPERKIIGSDILHMRNYGLVSWKSSIVIFHGLFLSVRHSAFYCGSTPRRTVAQSLYLLVFYENSVGAEPIVVTYCPVKDSGISYTAEIRLGIRKERHLVPAFVLDFINLQEGLLCLMRTFERIVIIRPCMSFTPETVHVRVHVFYQIAAIVFLGKHLLHFLEVSEEI